MGKAKVGMSMAAANTTAARNLPKTTSTNVTGMEDFVET
jgi:hypothetical protein